MKNKEKTSEVRAAKPQNKYHLNQKKHPIMKAGKVLFGVLIGAAFGALMGIAFAPGKGSRTRRKFLNKGENYLDEIKDKFDDFLSTMNDKLESNWQEVEALVAKEKTKLEEMKK